jgi:hypothetical protein
MVRRAVQEENYSAGAAVNVQEEKVNRDRSYAFAGFGLLQALFFVFFWSAAPVMAQKIHGVPGSPDATMTIDGRKLPPPPPAFGGVINERATDSKPYWRPKVVPPKGAPNVLLIMTDDVGFAAPSTFGGVIPAPALDRIAKMGLRFTQFHSTALRSPTRAALITGRNHHSAGFGAVSEIATGFPGYVRGEPGRTVRSMADRHGFRVLLWLRRRRH